jgi:nitrate/nitrite-specific signal transduction histidine kinase
MARPADDLTKRVEDLLDELDQINAELTSTTNPRANTIAIITAVGKFSCILTILSRQADRQTRRVICLTWAVCVLTFVLLLVAIAQLGIMMR